MSDIQPSAAAALTRRLAVQMAAGTAHEFNNMLAALVGLSDLLRTDPRLPAELIEDAERIHQATLTATRRVRHIQKIAGRTRPASALSRVEPEAVLRALAQHSTERHPIEVRSHARGAALGDPDDVGEILEHLIANAVEAAPNGSRIQIAVHDEGGRSIWTISDDGPGIPEDARERVFEPFFTTHAERRGRGLGLAVAMGLAESMGATLHLVPSVGGATFELSLAHAPGAGLGDTAASSCAERPSGPARILIVDDDPTVRDVLVRMVRMDHHEAVPVGSGAAALAEIEKGPFDVVVTDLGMPGMDGSELSRKIHERMPQAIIILATGWSPDQREMREKFEHVSLTVSKPVEYEGFAATIMRALQLGRQRAVEASTN